MTDGTHAHAYAQLAGVRLHYIEAGQGPLVVLLHGFPEYCGAWRAQLVALTGAGFRVVAPDMRGYGLSDKPAGVRSYGARALAEDVAGLIRACGAERATVVGHDWGGGVAWAFAMAHPELLERLVILDSPHPARFVRALRTARQLKKSWYMFAMLPPRLPEAMLRRDDFAMLKAPLLHDPLPDRVPSREEMEGYVEAWSQPGALTGMVNYYRAAFRPRLHVRARRVEAPVLVLWGDRDRYLGTELARPDAALVPNVRVKILQNASHWIHWERPDEVNAALVDFLRPS